MDIEEDEEAPILLGRPFLTTGKALIDMETGEIKFKVDGNEVMFNLNNMVQPKKMLECYQIDLVDTLVKEQQETSPPGVERVLVQLIEQEEQGEMRKQT
ncbi:hypothetical protein A2U01_0057429 [Trifolium medium]|uniref:Reverse transcriptase domain-containing protein n=1 Tax=Trifolium medium TaxID=97028 RepID=A0A392RIY3_9FABA|nr:hypothetical protein [Trifolium medium]